MSSTGDRVRAALAASSFDWLALGSAPNIFYATGYRSVAGDLFAAHRMLALVSVDRTVVVGGASDGAAALESGIAPDDYVPFGVFYFESQAGEAAETSLAGRHPTFEEAVSAALAIAGLAGTLGTDAPGAALADLLATGGASVQDATDWLYKMRAVKLPEEVERLRIAARLAEDGIDAAVAAAAPGATEEHLARIVASTMASGGGMPRFVVVTSGPRSALSDARATDRALSAGDLLRFDVGCTYEGYWSDIGRTAVVGEPSPRQQRLYDAILAGEQAQLDLMRPGVTAEEVFDVAVETVQAGGLSPYRRHHCGHAIGIEVYERPVVAPGWSTPLEPGMVFCVETPYYEIGWGGMMVEDTVVVTDEGVERLNRSDRSLRVIA